MQTAGTESSLLHCIPRYLILSLLESFFGSVLKYVDMWTPDCVYAFAYIIVEEDGGKFMFVVWVGVVQGYYYCYYFGCWFFMFATVIDLCRTSMSHRLLKQ